MSPTICQSLYISSKWAKQAAADSKDSGGPENVLRGTWASGAGTLRDPTEPKATAQAVCMQDRNQVPRSISFLTVATICPTVTLKPIHKAGLCVATGAPFQANNSYSCSFPFFCVLGNVTNWAVHFFSSVPQRVCVLCVCECERARVREGRMEGETYAMDRKFIQRVKERMDFC